MAIANYYYLRGHDLAYRIVDVMFDRKLFRHYTWTGQSMSGQKRPFVGFQKTILIFQKIVHIHDRGYDDSLVKEFFQSKILKGASQIRINAAIKPVVLQSTDSMTIEMNNESQNFDLEEFTIPMAKHSRTSTSDGGRRTAICEYSSSSSSNSETEDEERQQAKEEVYDEQVINMVYVCLISFYK